MYHGVNEQAGDNTTTGQVLADSVAGADHRDGHHRAAQGAQEGILSRGVVEDNRTHCSGSFSVHRLGAEVAYTAFDQGDLARKVSAGEISRVAAKITSQYHLRCHVTSARILHSRKPGVVIGRVDCRVRRDLFQHRI